MSKLTVYLPRTRPILAFLAVFVLAQMFSVMSAHSQSEPGAPTGVTATAGNAQATIAFNAPASVGGGPIMSYWVTASPGNIIGSGGSSPIIMTGLTNGTAYTFVVSATNSFGTGPNSSPSNSVTPAAASLTLSPPAGALPAGTVGSPYSVTFQATGGTQPYTYVVSGSLPAGLSLNSSTGAITGTPTTSGTEGFTVSVWDSSNTSATTSALYSISVNASQSDPATQFSAASSDTKQVVTSTVQQTTRNLYSRPPRRPAPRPRPVPNPPSPLGGNASNGSVSDVPLQIDGAFDATTTTLSSQGTFFGQVSLSSGAHRLVYGDFDIQHDSETGLSTATLNGRIAWEQSVSDKTMLGYFVGGELAHSSIAGIFDGDQNRVGVNAGGYAVHEIAEQVYVDGFFTLGAGRNNLSMSNGVLDLESNYTTRTAALGAVLYGVIEQQGFDILPELSLSYGRTWIGDVAFSGTANSLVDNNLNLEAGTVTLANILFRPQFLVPMDGLSGAQSLQIVTFAPRLSCEQVKTFLTEENCGGGAEVGFSGRSANGLSSVSAKVMADRIGGATISSLQLNLEHRF